MIIILKIKILFKLMILHLNVQLKKGPYIKKIEGDEKTPKGIFKLDKLY